MRRERLVCFDRAALVLVAVVALACTGCGGEQVPRGAGPDYAPDPGARGEFAVGVRTVQVEVAGASKPRSLRVEVWYPARLRDGQREADVVDFKVEAPAALRDQLRAVTSRPLTQRAARDAAVAEPDRASGFPLLLFSHGNSGSRLQSFFLMTHLASHGYVVVAPDHPGNTLFDVADGKNPLDSAALHAVERPRDISGLIDHVAAGTLTADGAIEASVDLSRVGVAGHSFGGFTALVLASRKSVLRDERIKAVVALSPATSPLEMFSAPASTIVAPTLYVGGARDVTATTAAELRPGYEAQRGPKALLEIDGVGHLGFTNMCGADIAAAARVIGAHTVMIEGIKDGCGADFRASDEAFALTQRFATTWLDTYLRDSAASAARYLTQADGTTLRVER